MSSKPSEAPERQPWEKMPKETAQAYAGFQAYLRLHPDDRSAREVARQLPKAKGTTCSAWMSRYDWRARAEAWDRHMARLELREQEDQVRSRAKRRMKVADSIWELVNTALDKLKLDTEKELSVSDITKLVKAGLDIEALAEDGFKAKLEEVEDDLGDLLEEVLADEELRKLLHEASDRSASLEVDARGIRGPIDARPLVSSDAPSPDQ